jgi:hypothetical protein
MDSLEGGWRGAFDASKGLTLGQLQAFATAVGLTPGGTSVTLADSASGTFVTESFEDVAQRLEAADPVSFGAGIYHF